MFKYLWTTEIQANDILLAETFTDKIVLYIEFECIVQDFTL